MFVAFMAGCPQPAAVDNPDAPDISADADTVGKVGGTVKANSEKTIKHADNWNRKSPAPEAAKIRNLQTSNIAEAGKLEIVEKNLRAAQTKVDELEADNTTKAERIVELEEELASSNGWIWTIGIAGGFALIVVGVFLFINGSVKPGIGLAVTGASSIGLALVLQMWSVIFAFIVGGVALVGGLIFLVYLIARRNRWVTELVRTGERMKKHIGAKWDDQKVVEDIATPQSPDLKVHIARVRVDDQLTDKPMEEAVRLARSNKAA